MKLTFAVAALCAALTVTHSCAPQAGGSPTTGTASSSESAPIPPKKSDAELAKLHKAYFAMGCFWCVEGVFESIVGVEEVVSGYAGGHSQNPTYEEVGTGRTGHAEAVEVYYDSTKIDFPTLLKVYFHAGDVTQVNGQGPDHGSQYRSVIFYQNLKEKMLAEQAMADLKLKEKVDASVAVEIKAFDKFWMAEEYHQDYEVHHPENPYVQHVSIPRMQKAQAQLGDLVKSGHKH